MAASVKGTAGTFEQETPRMLYHARWMAGRSNTHYDYDVTRDGQRFLFIHPTEDTAIEPLTLLINWQTGLKK